MVFFSGDEPRSVPPPGLLSHGLFSGETLFFGVQRCPLCSSHAELICTAAVSCRYVHTSTRDHPRPSLPDTGARECCFRKPPGSLAAYPLARPLAFPLPNVSLHAVALVAAFLNTVVSPHSTCIPGPPLPADRVTAPTSAEGCIMVVG